MAKSFLKKKYISISTPRNSCKVNLPTFPTYSLHCAYQHIWYPCRKISLKRVSQITHHFRSRALLPDAQALCGLSKHQAVSKRGSGCLLPLPLLGVSLNPSPELGSSSSPPSLALLRRKQRRLTKFRSPYTAPQSHSLDVSAQPWLLAQT